MCKELLYRILSQWVSTYSSWSLPFPSSSSSFFLLSCSFSLSHSLHQLHSDGGIGDDVFSLGFDGAQLWVGGTPVAIAPKTPPVTPSSSKLLRRQGEISSPTFNGVDFAPFSVGDVIGCCIDLEAEVAWFTKNGIPVKGHIRFHDCNDIITPAVSFSSGVK